MLLTLSFFGGTAVSKSICRFYSPTDIQSAHMVYRNDCLAFHNCDGHGRGGVCVFSGSGDCGNCLLLGHTAHIHTGNRNIFQNGSVGIREVQAAGHDK